MMGKFKRIFWLWSQCFRSMKQPGTFVPFFLYAVFQLLILYSLMNFESEPFSTLYIPLVQKIFGDAALHYPTFYYILVPFFNQINIILSGLVGVALIAVGTQLFAFSFNKEKSGIGDAIKSAMPKVLPLFVIWIIETTLTLLIMLGVPYLLKELLQISAADWRANQIIELGSMLLAVLISSFFAFTTALIVLDNQKMFTSIAQTFTIFRKNAITTFFLMAVPTLLYFPISYLGKKSSLLISKFSPEIMAMLIGSGILITFVTSYFQIGSITRFYLYLKEDRRR